MAIYENVNTRLFLHISEKFARGTKSNGSSITKSYLQMVVCFYLFVFFLFDSEIFHRHVDVIIMVKSCKFWPIIGSQDHWAARTHSDTGHPITWSSSRTMTPVAERLALKMSLLLWTTCLSRPGIESDFPRARRTVYRPMRSI